MIRDKTSHLGINLTQAACALGSFYKYSILEQHSQSSSSAYPALELKYSNRNKNNSPESRQHSCFHWRINTEVGFKARIREVETPPLIPRHLPPLPPHTHRHTNDSWYYSLKTKVPKLSLSRIYGVTVTEQGQTLEGNRDSSWAVRRSNHISPGAEEFSPEGLVYLILLFSNPITIMLR